jgi:hypothetical protein
MKTENLFLYGVIGFLAYYLLLRKKPNTTESMALTPINVPDGGTNTPTNGGAPGTEALMPTAYGSNDANTVGSGGKYYFRYAGSSALRTEAGQPINCGQPGNPFTSGGVETYHATKGFAPTTFFALLEMGTQASVYEGYSIPSANVSNQGGSKIRVGDKLQLKVEGGQFSALDGLVVTVLQLGTDACTASKTPEMMWNSVVVDVPIILQGADDYQYPAQDAIGCFKKL